MDTVALIGRLLVSLVAVLALMWLLARRMKKTGRVKDAGLIDVLGRHQLSRNSSVAVVRVGDQALVVGVTDTQISVLGQTDLDAALAAGAPGKTTARPVAGRGTGHRRRAAPRRDGLGRTGATSARSGVAAAASNDAPRPTDSGAENAPAPENAAAPRSPLAGSALSPQTWKQTLESLREMTAR